MTTFRSSIASVSSNPSIERTSTGGRRPFAAAAHVKRLAVIDRITMPVHRFSIPGHATRRDLSIYAVVAKKIDSTEWYVYVGKTGDNRAGCNPVVS